MLLIFQVCLAMLASVLQSCCELSGPKLGPGNDGGGGGAVCGHGAEYVTLLSQFLVQKSVMLGEKFNQLPKNVHGCTDALLKCGGGGWSR